MHCGMFYGFYAENHSIVLTQVQINCSAIYHLLIKIVKLKLDFAVFIVRENFRY